MVISDDPITPGECAQSPAWRAQPLVAEDGVEVLIVPGVLGVATLAKASLAAETEALHHA